MKINNLFQKIFNIYILLFIILFYNPNYYNKDERIKQFLLNPLNRNNYTNKKFAIIANICESCGLFSFFMTSLACIHKYLVEGFIPIIDIGSFPNVINGFNISKGNYWELFFEQPFGYTLEEVLNNSKNIKRIHCGNCTPRLYHRSMPFSEVQQTFWHNIAVKYIPIKKEILDLSNKIFIKLFRSSRNILGVLTRGTDYTFLKPKGHCIPPNISDLIHDVKKMDDKYIYDYIFFSTEDDNIRDIFSRIFSKKLKMIQPKIKTNYNKSNKKYLGYNDNIKGNIEYNKIYLLNIIILSKCLDIITARCNGSAGIFILTNGFRNSKVYDLGVY